MSKKKERTRQELNAKELDKNKEREELERRGDMERVDFMEDDMDVPDHNPNVDKDPGLKRLERDNIE